MLSASRRCVVFTGAGISTQSGIPDYRSPGGLWSRYRPVEFGDFLASEAARREYWRRKFDTHDAIAEAEPNEGHLAIAELQRRGTVIAVITQNVDGLHGACAPSAESVIELHGNTTFATCLGCAKRYELEPIREAFLTDESLPVSEDAGREVGAVETWLEIANAQLELGNYPSADETIGRAAELAEAVGNRRLVGDAMSSRAVARRMLRVLSLACVLALDRST